MLQTDVQALAARGFDIGMPSLGNSKTASIFQLKQQTRELLESYNASGNDVTRLASLMR